MRSKPGAVLIRSGKTTMTRIHVGHAVSVKASIHKSLPATVPRTLTILPVYCSGCWYKSQRVASRGCAPFYPQQKGQPAKRRTQPEATRISIFTMDSPLFVEVSAGCYRINMPPPTSTSERSSREILVNAVTGEVGAIPGGHSETFHARVS